MVSWAVQYNFIRAQFSKPITSFQLTSFVFRVKLSHEIFSTGHFYRDFKGEVSFNRWQAHSWYRRVKKIWPSLQRWSFFWGITNACLCTSNLQSKELARSREIYQRLTLTFLWQVLNRWSEVFPPYFGKKEIDGAKKLRSIFFLATFGLINDVVGENWGISRKNCFAIEINCFPIFGDTFFDKTSIRRPISALGIQVLRRLSFSR